MKKTIFGFLAALYGTIALSQVGEKTTTTIGDGKITTTQSWYASPWVWVVGAAVFILLLVALTRGGSRKD